jgi:hypothetical protein
LAGFVPAFQLDTSFCTLNCTFAKPVRDYLFGACGMYGEVGRWETSWKT